jgi:hypothetical protein
MEGHPDLTAAVQLLRPAADAAGTFGRPLNLDSATMATSIGPAAEFGLG